MLSSEVVGAKVVTNARSPGARCYGFVTMSTAEEATKCINHLHKTELHGKMISVEKAKNEPVGKKTSDKREGEGKKEKSNNADRYYSSQGDCGRDDPFLHFISFMFSTDGEGCEGLVPFAFLHLLEEDFTTSLGRQFPYSRPSCRASCFPSC